MKMIKKITDILKNECSPFFLIAGPCVIEDFETTFEIAQYLKRVTEKYRIPLIFKSSYDKANRSSIHSYRGPGIDQGLKILSEIKKRLQIPIISDVHQINEIEAAASVLDILQIPAFLCRQTDFITEVAKTQKPMNIKKGQFLSPYEVSNIIEKAKFQGNTHLSVTERGSSFGYNNLVVDFRSIPIIKDFDVTVIFDATHSVQMPGGMKTHSGGNREHAPYLARAAMAVGADGLFVEVHKDPEKALCDGPNSLYMDTLDTLLPELIAIKKAVIKS